MDVIHVGSIRILEYEICDALGLVFVLVRFTLVYLYCRVLYLLLNYCYYHYWYDTSRYRHYVFLVSPARRFI